MVSTGSNGGEKNFLFI